ncbi:hypothetical protein ACW73L_21905 [Methylolobus aquaticus]
MNYKPYFIVIVLCGSTALRAAPPSPIGVVMAPANPSMPAFAQGQGVLSYYFYNLTNQNCTLTASGAGANAAAYSSSAKNNGWLNSGEYNAPAFFNPDGIPYVVKNNQSNYYYSGKGTSDYFTSSYIFFDWPYSPIASPIPGQQALAGGGSPVSATLLSSAFNNWTWNTPGMGDSWYLSCTSPAGINADIAIASFATSQNALQSGNTGYYSYSDGTYWISANYWYPAYPGWFANSDINPVAEGNPSQPDQPCYGGVSPALYSCSNSYFCLNNQTSYTNPDPASLSWPTNPNPCGAGFTAQSAQTGSMIFNWNPSSSVYGGLWSGINYNNYSQISPYPAILTVNMPTLPINLATYVQPNNDNPAQLDPAVSWTPVMGGHFTYAIGDPFIISSFAAKILACLATVSSPLTNASDLASMSYELINGSNNQNPIFILNSTASNYVQWLLGSQSSPQNYPGAAQLAAKAYSQAFIAANSNPTTTKESVWGKIFQAAADAAVHALVSAIQSVPEGKVATALVQGATSVTGALISNLNATIASAYTTTTNPTLPLTATAPAVVNQTYSASNLLGIFLTNVAVQAEINTLMIKEGYTAFDTDVPPLLSNYTAYISGDCNSGAGSQAINTLSVIGNILQGTCTGTINPPNAEAQNPPSYTNVCQGNDCQINPPASNALSIWTAILTGSDIIVDGNGWLQLGDSADGNAPFEPPTQLYSPTVPGTFPSDATNPSVNTTFNANTFTLTAQSVEWNATSDCTYPASSVTGMSTTTCEYSLPTAPTLNYMNCVNDQNATGGIIVTFPTVSGTSLAATEVALACACIPTYIDGVATSGLVTGASSSNATMTCQQAATLAAASR